MKKSIVFTALLLIAQCGCVNLFERCPITGLNVNSTYQATDISLACARVIMFPQLIGPNGNLGTLYPENIFTIPVGCFCFADVACEAVLDTVFWPIDYLLENTREIEPTK